MIQLVINGQTYEYPESRDNPGWGAEATDWAQAVTSVLANITGTGDILQTSTTITNNQSSPANVTGLSFDPAVVRGAIVEYSVYRVTTSTGATELVEVGTMTVGFKNNANSWDITIVGGGGAGITFTMTNAGQVQYSTTNMTGSSYSGTMKFRARSLLQ